MPTVDEALQIAWQQHQAGNLRQAEQIYRQVIEVAPHHANAWCFLGMVCHDQGRFEEAVAAYDRALKIHPAFPIALSNLGNTYKQMGRFAESVSSCKRALELKPDYATAYNNLGAALAAKGDLEEASECFEKALSLMPDDAVTHANLSATHVRQGNLNAGTAEIAAALKLNPRYAEAHKNQGIIWLLQGDFERGWPEYEWRFKTPGGRVPALESPRWEGEPLAGKSILLLAEQGLGDTLQFMRYGTTLREQGARVIMACQKALLPLLTRTNLADEFVDRSESLPGTDFHCPLLSVPARVGTRVETIPAAVPYLAADSNLVDQWQQRLQDLPGFKVGIAWQGNPTFHADILRSIPLREFATLAELPEVTLISLQKGDGVDQLQELPFAVVDFGEDLDADAGPFMDTAAIMQCLDLVITSDTSVPHLAGALGVPTWTAIPLSPDWRWLLERTDCPWYPTMRLFRQSEDRDWSPVFSQIKSALKERLTHTISEVQDSPKGVAVSEYQPILVEVAPGELIDKITILEIKTARIQDKQKLRNVQIELETLSEARDSAVQSSPELTDMTQRLKAINEQLWDIEDDIRDCEREKDFGEQFVKLARSVYRCNDQRASTKKEINQLLGSRIVEEKSYQEYE